MNIKINMKNISCIIRFYQKTLYNLKNQKTKKKYDLIIAFIIYNAYLVDIKRS